jgi:hypothetical protein
MKRSAIWGVFALVIAVSIMSLPALAQSGKAVFEANLVPGIFPTQSEAGYVKGSVKVYADGTVEVSIIGAQPNETYNVDMGMSYYFESAITIIWAPVAGPGQLQLTTDGKGKGMASGWVAAWQYPYIVFALNDAENEEGTLGPNRYLTGFRYGY